MSRLNLIIAGAQRSATTSLKRGLMISPEISFISNAEEALSYKGEYVGFPFATPYNSRSIIGLENDGEVYEEMIKPVNPSRRERWNPLKQKFKYYGTKWPYFMVFPHIACNIRQHLPESRIIFILRNPADCLWSSFRKRYKGEDLTNDFGAYVEEGLASIEQGFDASNRSKWQHMLFIDERPATALDRGFYYPQIMNFLHLFGWSHIYIMNYNEFSDDPLLSLQKLLNWLNLPGPDENGGDYSQLSTRHNAIDEHSSAAVASASMSADIREKLNQFYEPSNEKLCKLLDWDIDAWIDRW